MSGSTNDEAARMAGVSLATVERYKADPSFRESMANLASESLLLVSERLVALSLRAVDVLEEVIINDQNRTADRLKAIELVLNSLEKAKSLSSSIGDRIGMGLEEIEVEAESEVAQNSLVESYGSNFKF
jgi:predicted RND superfamily exporter protein